jgi:N-methylhydantoinase A/oxoprolinase/acetone carboxylase beta subunit
VRGPAIFEEYETSCAIGPDATATVDAHHNLIIEIDHAHPHPASQGDDR